MQHAPLNQSTPFEPWPRLDAGVFIESNPGYVRVGPDLAFAVFRRDQVPPRPGHGSVWAVRVDEAMRPVGRPQPLLAQGEDPRAVLLDGRVLVFYVLMERNEDAQPVGCSMALAEFEVEGGALTLSRHFQLPRYPLGTRDGIGLKQGWEKNWVPFPLPGSRVGLIYGHRPWDVLELDVPADSGVRRFTGAHHAPGLRWDWGAIRGGTVPVALDEGRLVSFFHSSVVAGSRNVYVAGACVFEAQPPFRPLLMTRDPLLVAPYRSTVARHGWPFSISVVFPLGAEAVAQGFRLLCGIDDGEVATFTVPRDVLMERLEPVQADATALSPLDTAGAQPVALPLVLAPQDAVPLADQPLIRFARLLAGRGRRCIDVGAGWGSFSLALAGGYAAVEAFEHRAPAREWLRRNVALNGAQHVRCHDLLPGADDGAGLDALGYDDIDLLHIDAAVDPLPVLVGARRVLAGCAPALLLHDPGTDADRSAALAAELQRSGYGMEALFPRSPTTRLCLPAAQRQRWSWFV